MMSEYSEILINHKIHIKSIIATIDGHNVDNVLWSAALHDALSEFNIWADRATNDITIERNELMKYKLPIFDYWLALRWAQEDKPPTHYNSQAYQTSEFKKSLERWKHSLEWVLITAKDITWI